MLLKKLIAVTVSCGFITGLPAYLAAAEDWWEDSPYYAEDAWYDVTEWFDGNEYHYVDNANDNSETDYDSDSDYDYDYDYDYGYGYGYGPDTNGYDFDPDIYDDYGFDDLYDGDDWFYDYWDDGYASFKDWDDDGNYDFSSSYYDYDGDGLYDAYFAYHDWNDDGIYDDVDYFSFNDSENDSNQSAQANARKSKSSKREMVRGEVVNIKKATVRDTKHLIVKMEKPDGSEFIVELGPASKLQQLNIAEGDHISVRGPMTKVGDRKVLIAQALRVDGNSQGLEKIQRNGQQFRGEVAGTRSSKVRGKKHSFVILASANNKKKLVDLGPADDLNVDPKEGDQISITAVPIKVDDRVVLMAQEVRCNGKKCEIDRTGKANSQRGNQQRDSRKERQDNQDRQTSKQLSAPSLTGKVEKTRELTVRGNERRVATIKTQRGDRILVDLGPAGEFDENLRNGDQITVRGPMVKSSKNKLVVLARSLERDGEKIALGRRGTMHSDATQKTIRGEVTSTRKTTVRGKQRQLAKVETDQGQTVVVDLGPPTALGIDLAEGDQLVAHGALVKAGNQTVLIAYELEDQNGSSVAINRHGSQMTR